jgi:dihydrofolate reductase
MRKIIVTTWTSPDGFVSGAGGDMGFVGRFYDASQGEYQTEIATRCGTLLLGRRTYDSFAGAWPHVPDNPDVSEGERVYARLLNAMDKVLVSRTVTDPSWDATTVWDDVRAADVEALKAKDGKDIAVYGSTSVVRRLTDLRLVDEYHIQVHPVALGEGLSLFAGLEKPAFLTLVDSVRLATGVTRLVMVPAEDAKS